MNDGIASGFPKPWNLDENEITVAISDVEGRRLALADPSLNRRERLAIARHICSAVCGPTLRPDRFYRERFSGRTQTGQRWREEFEEVVSREYCEIDLREVLEDPQRQ